MPPKKGAPSKQTQAKQKQKLEDKTFGIKNKKGAKNQKFIQTSEKAAGMDKGAKARADAKKAEDRKNKIEDEKRFARQQMLLKEKIQKAKELTALRTGNEIKTNEPVEEAEVIVVSGPSLTLTVGPTQMSAEQLAKLARKNAPKKEKVVEVIISLEELIENERAALHKKGNLTPVTVDTFAKWKAKVNKEKAAKLKKQQIDKKTLNKKTGREFFESQNPNVVMKDADEEEEEEVDARIEVRDKRITDEDKGTLVFGETGDTLTVEKLSISEPAGGATA